MRGKPGIQNKVKPSKNTKNNKKVIPVIIKEMSIIASFRVLFSYHNRFWLKSLLII